MAIQTIEDENYLKLEPDMIEVVTNDGPAPWPRVRCCFVHHTNSHGGIGQVILKQSREHYTVMGEGKQVGNACWPHCCHTLHISPRVT